MRVIAVFCAILAYLNYEHTKSGNEHAKSDSGSKQELIKHTCCSG